MSIYLGQTDSVIVRNPRKNQTWSGTVYTVDYVLVNCTDASSGYEYNVFMILDVKDYKEIIKQGWQIYYNKDSCIKKYYISQMRGDEFDLLPMPETLWEHSNSDESNTIKGCTFDNIVAILIAHTYFQMIPTNTVNHTVPRFPIPLFEGNSNAWI